MPVVVTQILPSEVTMEMARRVTEEAGAERAEGLIVHAAVHDDEAGAIRLVALWESKEAFERFSQENVLPAVRRMAAEAGIEARPPQTRMADTFVLVRGKH